MDQREAQGTLVTSDFSNSSQHNHYSMTVNLSPRKLVSYFNGRRITYGDLNHDDQKAFIKKHVDSALCNVGIHTYRSNWEDTKKGFPHLHFLLYTTEERVLSVQQSIQQSLGLPKVAPHVVCYYEKTTVDPKFWVDYMTKEEESPQRICPTNILLSSYYKPGVSGSAHVPH